LKQLSTLKRLTRLDFRYDYQSLGVKDVEWMVSNWKILKSICGVLNSNMDQRGALEEILIDTPVEKQVDYLRKQNPSTAKILLDDSSLCTAETWIATSALPELKELNVYLNFDSESSVSHLWRISTKLTSLDWTCTNHVSTSTEGRSASARFSDVMPGIREFAAVRSPRHRTPVPGISRRQPLATL
jgi:hypothetical protein